MTLHVAEKVVIITENIISSGVIKIIDACGASGYTLIAAGGRGSRGMRSSANRTSMLDDFANVKIEVIVEDTEMGEKIMEGVKEKFFNDYSGITYLEDVRVLRPKKFTKSEED